jgi:hypothetical protein
MKHFWSGDYRFSSITICGYFDTIRAPWFLPCLRQKLGDMRLVLGLIASTSLVKLVSILLINVLICNIIFVNGASLLLYFVLLY